MSGFDSLAFEPGQQVQCKTRFDDVLKGEVVAFDLNSKVLILKSASSTGNSNNHDLQFLVLDSVSDVEILQEPQGEYNKNLPNVDLKYLKVKSEAAENERMRLVEAVGNGVSRDGISLFTAFSKKYGRASDITWKDKVKIVVLNSVVISPPYKESDCEAMTKGTSQEALGYVKSNVRKFWEDFNKQKSSTA